MDDGGDAAIGEEDAKETPVPQTRAAKRYTKIPAPSESVLTNEKRTTKRWIKRKGD